MAGPETELILAKGRDTATGVVPLVFSGSTVSFAEVSSREPGDEREPF